MLLQVERLYMTPLLTNISPSEVRRTMSKKLSGSMKEDNPQKQYAIMITSTDLMFQKISESLTASGLNAVKPRFTVPQFTVSPL
jgi:hypothetical protein